MCNLIDKPWRIHSTEEFIDRSLEYLAPMIYKFTTGETVLCNDKMKYIKNKLSLITEDRVRSKSKKEKLSLIGDMLDIALQDVKDWSEFSLNPESSLDDIMLRSIITVLYKKSFVCFLYLSHNKNLTEDFIRDLNYVTSGMFKFEEFDDEHVNAINKYFEIENFVPWEDEDVMRLYNVKKNKNIVGDIPNNHYGSKHLGILFPKLDYKDLADRYGDWFKKKYKPVCDIGYRLSSGNDDDHTEHPQTV